MEVILNTRLPRKSACQHLALQGFMVTLQVFFQRLQYESMSLEDYSPKSPNVCHPGIYLKPIMLAWSCLLHCQPISLDCSRNNRKGDVISWSKPSILIAISIEDGHWSSSQDKRTSTVCRKKKSAACHRSLSAQGWLPTVQVAVGRRLLKSVQPQ